MPGSFYAEKTLIFLLAVLGLSAIAVAIVTIRRAAKVKRQALARTKALEGR